LAADKVIDRAMGKTPQHNGRTKAHARGMDQIIVAQASGPPARARAG
jgi:hypothetical protein